MGLFYPKTGDNDSKEGEQYQVPEMGKGMAGLQLTTPSEKALTLATDSRESP